MSDKLKPCPFCGGKPKLYLGKGAYGVLCTCDRKAFIHTYAGTGATAAEAKANAIAAWNTRADLADALAAALRSAQRSIADMMGVHGYQADSGAGEILREVNAALAAWGAAND